jgi:hypothetical protein
MAKYKQHGQKLNNNNKCVELPSLKDCACEGNGCVHWGTLLCLPCENAIVFLGKSECVV